MRLDVVSIFPDYFAPLHLSLVGKALGKGLLELGVHDLRQWTHDRHNTVDDTPYGGGAGMVMKPEPWGECLDALLDGGRYEGIDRRVMEHAATRMEVRELSLGDYVLNGGEVATLAMVEAVVRLIPGVIGNPESLTEESHSDGQDQLLEYPVYTKPPSWRGLDVPEVLFSGHHARIAEWRHEQAVELTRRRRPDLLPE